jgi:hypothetical protein
MGLQTRYTLQGYSIYFKDYSLREANAVKKLDILNKFTSVIKYIPMVRMIGLSGSVSMMNAKKSDDIDICIIAQRNRMWTARFVTSLIANFMGVRRKRNQVNVNNKICLNLFFDENDLLIPSFKQTEYVGHELLQMKIIVNKNFTYERFLKSNTWVHIFFPNTKYSRVPKTPHVKNTGIGNLIESMLKTLQRMIINRHRTTEIITDNQLWFFPHDYELKIKHLYH